MPVFQQIGQGRFMAFHGFGRSPISNRSTAFEVQGSVHRETGNHFHSHKYFRNQGTV